jgi:hypothetical protein
MVLTSGAAVMSRLISSAIARGLRLVARASFSARLEA